MKWKPILNGCLEELAFQAVHAILADLRGGLIGPASAHASWSWAVRQSSAVASGQAGLALLFSYVAQIFPEQDYDDPALEMLEQAIDGVLEGRIYYDALYSGFSGVAWVVEHLREQFAEAMEGDPNEEIVVLIRDALAKADQWYGLFDLTVGLTGLGVFALERLPRSGGLECLELVVSRLSEIAEHRPEGITWRIPQHLLRADRQAAHPQGELNLGVAHGIPGVIGFLGRACAAGSAEARRLLASAVPCLLAQKLPSGGVSMFPYRISPTAPPEPSRLAWCYGDIGIAAALLAAGHAAEEPEWQREALEIGRFAAARRPETAIVYDAGLCHGAAGIAHLFNRLYQASGDEVFETAAIDWFERALDMRRPGEGIGGFISLLSEGPGTVAGWQPDPSFLTGAAGIALALLAAVTPVFPSWDRLLLASPQ